MTQESHYWAYTLRKTITEKGTCTPLFITALCAIARAREQPRCLLTVEWIKKLWYIYTMEYYSDIKRSGFESILLRWMNLEPVIEGSKSEREKQISYINAYTWNLEKWYWWAYLNGRNRDAYVENKLMDTVGEGQGRINWESSIDIYILSCVK